MLFECLETRHLLSTTLQDHLFIGDQGDPDNPADDSVVQFDATNGRLIGSFVSTGQLIGPRGMVPNGEDLLVVNQNVDQPVNGEVRRFDGSSGAALSGLVLQDHPQAPFAPRGMVVKDNVVFVADALGSSIWGPSFPPISKYDATSGAFLGHLIPNACFTSELHPRGLVFGSDGRLYAAFLIP